MILDHRDLLAHPDGFIGQILAVEGIVDACTILNGPTGCKSSLGEAAKDMFRRENAPAEMRWAEEFFFGQDRLPCTYLDDYDYIYGAAEKLEYVFPRIAGKGYGCIAVLNSPGASLIGDDLQRYLAWSGLAIPATVLDRPHFGEDFAAGWLDAAGAILDTLAPSPQARDERSINLLGASIWHRHWTGSLRELGRLLGLCGVRVQAQLLAGCSVAELRGLRRAACNLVVHDELGLGLARELERRYGMAWAVSEAGAPVGFDATEAWLRCACAAVGADPGPALASIAADRQIAAERLHRCTTKVGYPRGAGFAVALDASLAWPLTRWLVEYLAMVPVAIQVPDESQPAAVRLRAWLEEIGAGAAWNMAIGGDPLPEAVFASDAVILRVTRDRKHPVGIDLAMPAKDGLHFLPRSALGSLGALQLLERLCNGLWAIA